MVYRLLLRKQEVRLWSLQRQQLNSLADKVLRLIQLGTVSFILRVDGNIVFKNKEIHMSCACHLALGDFYSFMVDSITELWALNTSGSRKTLIYLADILVHSSDTIQ